MRTREDAGRQRGSAQLKFLAHEHLSFQGLSTVLPQWTRERTTGWLARGPDRVGACHLGSVRQLQARLAFQSELDVICFPCDSLLSLKKWDSRVKTGLNDKF